MLSRLSISMRLALWYGLSLLLLLTVFVAGLYASVHFGLHRDLDRQLRSDADAVAAHMQAHQTLRPSTPDVKGNPQVHDHSAAASTDAFVRLLKANGSVVQTGGPSPHPAFAPDLPASEDRTLRRHTVNGHTAKTLYVPLGESDAEARWLEVTRMESALHVQLHRLRWLLVIGILLGAGGALGAGYGLARTSLRPVAVLTDAAREMKDRPSGTLPTDFGRRDELTALAETFNDLFRRLRSTLERERRFRADAAHEMFTPLTAIRSELDVTLRSRRDASTYRQALQTVRGHVSDLSAILERLTVLSELEARPHKHETPPLDAETHLQSCIDDVAPTARSCGVTLRGLYTSRTDLPSAERMPVRLRVAAEHLTLIVDHLLENAVKYTPDGGTACVSLHTSEKAACIRVADTGIGFETENADRLFDRFYRTPQAAETAGGGGLGLALVDAVAARYGGEVFAHSDGPGTGSCFQVHFPRDVIDQTPSPP